MINRQKQERSNRFWGIILPAIILIGLVILAWYGSVLYWILNR